MKFGVSIPTCREGMDLPPGYTKPEHIIQLATLAEELGYDSCWGNDHITPSLRIRGMYSQMPKFYEVLISLTYCAAITRSIRLGIGVIVLPFRDPIILAKQLATLDVFSKGRIMLGVGIGTNREELEMLYPRQSNGRRGEMMDESIEAMDRLFTQPVASFSAKYYEFKDVILEPRPLQKPFPLYLSGRSALTLDRTIKYGTGIIVSSPTIEELQTKVKALRAMAKERGRDFAEIEVMVNPTLSIARSREEAIEAFRTSHTGKRSRASNDIDVIISRSLIGTPEEIVMRIKELRNAGTDHCVITGIAADTVEGRMQQMEMFSKEVMPAFRDS